MWDLPRPGIEPVSPALAGGFLTTAPPGKSQLCSCGFCVDECGKQRIERSTGDQMPAVLDPVNGDYNGDNTPPEVEVASRFCR